jgi:glycine/D-amino acid oxidase-like deaminating enzyme
VKSKSNKLLIVGGGLAGSTLALELAEMGVEITLIDNQFPHSSSRVAAGLLNPIVPKGVRKTWQCHALFPALFTYYQRWESLLQNQFIHPFPFLNIHANEGETREWRNRTQDPELFDWIRPDTNTEYPSIPRTWASWVNHCGRLDVPQFLKASKRYLERAGQYKEEEFNHSTLVQTHHYWEYKGESYTAVVFCEGIGILQNPWFNHLFFDPTGGDILTVHIPNLGENPCIIKQKQWIVPTTEKDIYLLGSNFHKHNLSHVPKAEDAELLLARAAEITQQTVTLIEHRRSVRPTVQERRPYLGEHTTNKGLYVFNGLGAKGSSLCSWLSPMMANHLVHGDPLNEEVDIRRFI